jgi:hypothetical protein
MCIVFVLPCITLKYKYFQRMGIHCVLWAEVTNRILCGYRNLRIYSMHIAFIPVKACAALLMVMAARLIWY